MDPMDSYLPAMRSRIAFLSPLTLLSRPLRHNSVLSQQESHATNSVRHWLPPRRAPILASIDLPTPMAIKLDGKATAVKVREEVAEQVTHLVEKYGDEGRPGLAVVRVGDRKDSETYVRNKRKACEEVGIFSTGYELGADVGEEKVIEIVEELNGRKDIHGILVQLPLPDSMNEEKVLQSIRIEKDVDGFHVENMGRLCMSGKGKPLFVPCTPRGCVELLDRYGIEIEGKEVVVIGRSNIVGLPVAMLLMHRNATVTICHSRTKDVAEKVKKADIIVAACGKAGFVKSEWIKEGSVVVDVGINAVEDQTKKRGYRLVGDVEQGAEQSAGYLTPVPGGIGPMTIAMLLQNTLEACKRAVGA